MEKRQPNQLLDSMGIDSGQKSRKMSKSDNHFSIYAVPYTWARAWCIMKINDQHRDRLFKAEEGCYVENNCGHKFSVEMPVERIMKMFGIKSRKFKDIEIQDLMRFIGKTKYNIAERHERDEFETIGIIHLIDAEILRTRGQFKYSRKNEDDIDGI